MSKYIAKYINLKKSKQSTYWNGESRCQCRPWMHSCICGRAIRSDHGDSPAAPAVRGSGDAIQFILPGSWSTTRSV